MLLIVGVLAGIAYPSYASYLKRSASADAKAEFVRMRMAVEKQRLTRIGVAPAVPFTWTAAAPSRELLP